MDAEVCTRMLLFVVDARTCVFVLPSVVVNSIFVFVIIVVVDMNDEEDGERALGLRAFVEDDGGENCEFESMSE
jgi:hypothetical protein